MNAHEPRPPLGDVVQPAWLSAGASVVWVELAPICAGMGTLTVADTTALGVLCELAATFALASTRKHDAVRADNLELACWVKLERNTATALRPFLEQFGLTPSGRARISVPTATPDAPSKWSGAIP